MLGSGMRQTGSRSAGSILLRRTIVLAVMVAMAGLALSAATAGATIKFCSKTVCIGSPNGCSSPTSTGVVIQADNGDSFIATDGTKWTCTNGKWVKTSQTRPTLPDLRGPVLGIGEFFQGPRIADPCDLSPTFRESVTVCQPIIILL